MHSGEQPGLQGSQGELKKVEGDPRKSGETALPPHPFINLSEQPMSILSRFMRGALASLALATATLSASAAPTTQLGFLIDASGSIGAANFATMQAGYAAALGALPADGSIEVTVYTFSDAATAIVAPVVLNNAADVTAVVAAINAIVYSGGTTATDLGIGAIAGAMITSTNFAPGLRSIINLATDGVPNDQAAAVAAAAAAQARGIDAMTAEAIGGSAVTAAAIADMVFSPIAGPCAGCGVVLPDGSIPPNPMTSAPWVLQIDNFNDFPTAINAKVQAITRVPEPGSVALVGLALGVVGVIRRRKA